MPARSVCMVTTLTGVAWMCPESVCILTKAKSSSVGTVHPDVPWRRHCMHLHKLYSAHHRPLSPRGCVLPVNMWVVVDMQAPNFFPQPQAEPGDGDLHLSQKMHAGQTCDMPLARESPILHCDAQKAVASSISAWEAMSYCIMPSHGASKEAARQSNSHLMLSPARLGRNFYNG